MSKKKILAFTVKHETAIIKIERRNKAIRMELSLFC